MCKFFRPEWTCGRYDEKHRVAIYYNLIEGMAYFFEDESASVIGELLKTEKNAICYILNKSLHFVFSHFIYKRKTVWITNGLI